MSKKMMKRSLALGALMAFVITGSAMAAELTISSDAEYAKVISKEIPGWFHGTYITSVNSTSDNTLTIGNVNNVDVHVYAGYVGSANSSTNTANNTLNIVGDVNSSKRVIAAYINKPGTQNAEAINNKVSVSGDAKLGNLLAAAHITGAKNITVENNTVSVEGVEDGAVVKSVYGAYAKADASTDGLSTLIEGENNVVNISDNTTVTNGGEGVYGAYARSVAQTNATGTANSSATAILKNNSVTISGGVVNSNVYGAYAIAETWDVITKLNAQANGNKVNLSGGTITGKVYGGYSVKINEFLFSDPETEASTASNNEVNISGTANVEDASLFGNNDDDGITGSTGNTLNIGDGWSGKIKSAQNFNAINIIEGANATFKTALNDANVAVNVKGATWTVDKTNTVGSASFDASSVLSIDGATFDASKTTDYALNGTGELKVANGATLAIKGIDYVKYNVAEGFTSIVDGNGNEFADGAEYWKLENTLMEGVWTTDNGLQVEVKAKKAEDIAEDMGVSVNIANTMTEIINIANENKGNITEGTPQANVVDFANALADAAPEVAGQAVEAVVKMAEAGGNNATAANIVKNVTGVTNDRLSFNCGHSAPYKGGHGVGLFEEGSGADIWVEYVHGKDKVEDMKSTAGASSYEGQYNGLVMGVDFKKVNKFQSGIAFNYGEGDTNSVGSIARTHSDYDFWGVGYYGNIHNDDSNIIFDINYAKTDSDVTQNNISGLSYEASPETTTWTAGVKVEKLYQNENVQIVPYTGLRYVSIDADDYSTKCGTYNYKMERQNIWLLPVGVSIKQEVTNDNGWTVSPRVDLSYIWAFGDTDSNMGFGHALDNKITNIGYDVMDDGSFLGLVGIEAHKGQWGYGVSYSYQKGDHSESKKWFVDVNYSF